VSDLSVAIEQKTLAVQLTNLFELAMIRGKSWWDVQALVYAIFKEPALPSADARKMKRKFRFPYLDKEVIICLMKDLDACFEANEDYARHYSPFVEHIKASLFRSRRKSENNFMNCQLRLALKYVIDVIQVQFRSWRHLGALQDLCALSCHLGIDKNSLVCTATILKPDSIVNLEESVKYLGQLDMQDKDKVSLFAVSDFSRNLVRFSLRSTASTPFCFNHPPPPI